MQLEFRIEIEGKTKRLKVEENEGVNFEDVIIDAMGKAGQYMDEYTVTANDQEILRENLQTPTGEIVGEYGNVFLIQPK